MTQAIITAAIAGCCSIVSAVLSALISRHGLVFWRSATVIRCAGTARELQAIRADGKIDDGHRGYTYDIRDGTLSIRNDRARFSGLLTTTEGESTVSDGHVRAKGTFRNGVAFLVYSAKDIKRDQAWSGLILVRVPGLGDLTGYWLTEDHVDPGVIAFGSISLGRS